MREGEVIRTWKVGNEVKALVAGRFIGQERIIVLQSPNPRDIGKQVGGFFSAGEPLPEKVRQKAAKKEYKRFTERRKAAQVSIVEAERAREQQLRDNAITRQVLGDIETARAAKTKEVAGPRQAAGPPSPTESTRPTFAQRLYSGLPPTVKIEVARVQGIVAGVQNVPRYQRMRNIEEQQKSTYDQYVSQESAVRIERMRLEREATVLNRDISAFNRDVDTYSSRVQTLSADGLTESEYNQLSQQRSSLQARGDVLGVRSTALGTEVQDFKQREGDFVAKGTAVNVLGGVLQGQYGDLRKRKWAGGAFEEGFASKTSQKWIPELGPKGEQAVRYISGGARFLPRSIVPLAPKPDTAVGIVEGGLTGLRDRPIQIAAITAISAGTSAAAVGIGASGKVATAATLYPKTFAVARGVGVGFKAVAGATFVGVKGYQLYSAGSARARGRVIGQTITAELGPAVLGTGIGTAIGKELYGKPVRVFQTQSKQREIYRTDKESGFDIKAKQTVRNVASKRTEQFKITGASKTMRVKQGDVSFSYRPESKYSSIYVQNKEFKVLTSEVPQIRSVLNKGETYTFSESLLNVKGPRGDNIARFRGLSVTNLKGETTFIRTVGFGGTQIGPKSVSATSFKDISKPFMQMDDTVGYISLQKTGKDIGVGGQVVEYLPSGGKTQSYDPSSLFQVEGVTLPRITIQPTTPNILPVSTSIFTSATAPLATQAPLLSATTTNVGISSLAGLARRPATYQVQPTTLRLGTQSIAGLGELPAVQESVVPPIPVPPIPITKTGTRTTTTTVSSTTTITTPTPTPPFIPIIPRPAVPSTPIVPTTIPLPFFDDNVVKKRKRVKYKGPKYGYSVSFTETFPKLKSPSIMKVPQTKFTGFEVRPMIAPPTKKKKKRRRFRL